MPDTRTSVEMSRPRLRLWPGVVLVVLQWLIRFVMPAVASETSMFAVIGGIAGGAAVLIWWLFLSRAPGVERLGAIALMAVALFATSGVVHESIANGMMGMMLIVFSIPLLSLALVTWAVASARFGTTGRWVALVGAIAIACGAVTVVRTGGITGDATSDLHWRWTDTPEERLLARDREEPFVPPAAAPAASPDNVSGSSRTTPSTAVSPTTPSTAPPAVESPETPRSPSIEEPEAAAEGDAATHDWPAFRGAARDGI